MNIKEERSLYMHRTKKYVCSIVSKKEDPLDGTKLYCEYSDGVVFSISTKKFKKEFRRITIDDLELLKKNGDIKERSCKFCNELKYNAQEKCWETPVSLGEMMIGVRVKACPYCFQEY